MAILGLDSGKMWQSWFVCVDAQTDMDIRCSYMQ